MHWLLPEPKGERSYFSICSRIQALRPCISSNSSMIQPIIAHSAGSEGYSWWDWSTWRGRSRCNVPGHQLLQLSRYAGGMWSMYQAIWLIWGSVGEVTCISMVALMMTARLHFTTLQTFIYWSPLREAEADATEEAEAVADEAAVVRCTKSIQKLAQILAWFQTLSSWYFVKMNSCTVTFQWRVLVESQVTGTRCRRGCRSWSTSRGSCRWHVSWPVLLRHHTSQHTTVQELDRRFSKTDIDIVRTKLVQ